MHQHLDIGQGEVDWDAFFGTLERLEFDGIMTACVFAWEERAEILALHGQCPSLSSAACSSHDATLAMCAVMTAEAMSPRLAASAS